MSLTMWMLASAAVAAGEEWGALEACAEGVGEACRLAAEAYLQGDLGEADLTTGLELYGRACELDSAEACLFLGDRLRQGVGVAPDLGLAAEWYGVACLLGAGDACRTVADYHVERSIPNANPDFASEWYTRGCDVGDAASCMNLVAVIEAGLPAGGALPVRALGFLGSACTSGMVDACTQLAHTLRVVKPLEAVGWIERGCELGHLPSCRDYGLALVEGDLVKRDREAGARFLSEACEADDAVACAALGDLLRRTDPAAALAASSRACGLGDDKACRRAWKLRRRVER